MCFNAIEMGLGKTLMTIATISALHRQNRTNVSDMSLHLMCAMSSRLAKALTLVIF